MSWNSIQPRIKSWFLLQYGYTLKIFTKKNKSFCKISMLPDSLEYQVSIDAK